SFDADSRGWARIFSGLRAAVLAFLGFAGAWCGAFPGGLLAWRVAPLAFVSVRRRFRCRGVVPALRARFLVSAACRALGLCAGCYLGGGGVGGPRPGRREPVHGGFSATSMSPKPGRRPPTPPPRTMAGAAAEGPARHLPGPSPALVVGGGRGAAPRFGNSASACGVRADAAQVTGCSPVADAALFAAAQQTRPGGPSDRRCDDAS